MMKKCQKHMTPSKRFQTVLMSGSKKAKKGGKWEHLRGENMVVKSSGG